MTMANLTGVWLLMVSILVAVMAAKVGADCLPPSGCSKAWAFVTLGANDTLTILAKRYAIANADYMQILWSNFSAVINPNTVAPGQTFLVPFPCITCTPNTGTLSKSFIYSVVQGDLLSTIPSQIYSNLTNEGAIMVANNLNSPDLAYGTSIQVPINCSCGDPNVNTSYGLFVTYVARPGDTGNSLEKLFNVSADLIQKYNTHESLDSLVAYSSILFIPGKDVDGLYPPLNFSVPGGSGLGNPAIIGISVGGVIAFLFIACLLYFCFFSSQGRKNKNDYMDGLLMNRKTAMGMTGEDSQSTEKFDGLALEGASHVLDKTIRFTYGDLVAATDNFNITKEIGKGGFATVYYGEYRGLKLAVKKMELKAEKQFIAELQVLLQVNHTNLVKLLGYCTTNYLFLVYEYVENGTLNHHLIGRSKEEVLPWATRVQIAIDSARALEYIHEYTVPSYVHRDIKPNNILLEMNFRAKVADFGLTKLTIPVSNQTTNVAGTYGYMAPEYVMKAESTPKTDVYSFGVVLYQLICARNALVYNVEDFPLVPSLQQDFAPPVNLVYIFKKVIGSPDAKEKMHTLVDPALGDNYPLDSVWQMAKLAEASTRENPDERPSMQRVVIALLTLSSTTQEWDFNNSNAKM